MKHLQFVLGLAVVVGAAALWPDAATATDCAILFQGERTALTPAVRLVDDEVVDLGTYEDLGWTLSADARSDIRIVISTAQGDVEVPMDKLITGVE